MQIRHSSILTYNHHYINNNNNSVALVGEQTIPTERPPLVSEVSANFCGEMGVAGSERRIPTAAFSIF
jgi:hypothetical protein